MFCGLVRELKICYSILSESYSTVYNGHFTTITALKPLLVITLYTEPISTLVPYALYTVLCYCNRIVKAWFCIAEFMKVHLERPVKRLFKIF